MSEAMEREDGSRPSLKQRAWAAGEAVASLASRCAAALLPMAAMWGAGSLAAGGMGIQSPGFMQTMGMIAMTPLAVGAPLVAAWGAAKAFKEGSAGNLSWDGVKRDAGFIGGLSAGGAFTGLGLGLAASAAASTPYVGGLLGAPLMAAGAVAVVAGVGVAGMMAMDARAGGKEPESGAPEPAGAPLEGFSLAKLHLRREQKAAGAVQERSSAPGMA